MGANDPQPNQPASGKPPAAPADTRREVIERGLAKADKWLEDHNDGK